MDNALDTTTHWTLLSTELEPNNILGTYKINSVEGRKGRVLYPPTVAEKMRNTLRK